MGRRRDAHGDARGSETLRNGVNGETPTALPPPASRRGSDRSAAPTPSPTTKSTTRVRHDGWTDARRRVFLRALSETGCVRDACRRARISLTSAYRKRERDAGFARRWDRAIAKAAPTIEQAAYERGVTGWDEPIVSGGKIIGTKKRYSDSLLRLLMVRGEMGGDGARAAAGTGAGEAEAEPERKDGGPSVGPGEKGRYWLPDMRVVGPWKRLIDLQGREVDPNSPVGQAFLAAEALRDGANMQACDGSGCWVRDRHGDVVYSSSIEARKEVSRRLDLIAAAMDRREAEDRERAEAGGGGGCGDRDDGDGEWRA